MVVTFWLLAISDSPHCGLPGHCDRRREVLIMETLSLYVSILSLVVSAVSLGIALGSLKTTAKHLASDAVVLIAKQAG